MVVHKIPSEVIIAKTVNLKSKVGLKELGGGRITAPDYLAGNSMNLVSSEATNGYFPGGYFFREKHDDVPALVHAQNGIMKSFGEPPKVEGKPAGKDEEGKVANQKFIGFEVVPKTEVSHFPDGHKVTEKDECVQVEFTLFADGEKSALKTEIIDGHRVQHSEERKELKIGF